MVIHLMVFSVIVIPPVMVFIEYFSATKRNSSNDRHSVAGAADAGLDAFKYPKASWR